MRVAVADFDIALQIAPESPEAYYYRATAKFEWGKSEQGTRNTEHAKRLYHAAIEDYTQVMTLDPENPSAYIFGGTVHLRLADLERTVGNSQQARHHFQEVHKMGHQLTDLDPENASGWGTRGVANHRLGILAADRGDREQAQRYYEAGIEAYTQAVAFGSTNPSGVCARGGRCIVPWVFWKWCGTVSNRRSSTIRRRLPIRSKPSASRLPNMPRSFPRISVWHGVRLGVSEVALGNIQAAQQQYQSAMEGFNEVIGIGPAERLGAIAPTDVFTAIAYNGRAEAQLRFGESETLTGNVPQAEQYYREAIADCDQVLTLGFQQVEAFYTRGRAKVGSGGLHGRHF